MTWIKTVPFDEADEKLRRAMEAQRELYPVEYAQPVHPTPDGESSGIVASHSLIPDAPPARDDHDGRLGHEPLPLLNRVARRVSASGHAGRRAGAGIAGGLPD